MIPTPHHWDIFCRVVDNFGDIGVCWRLAHQLATDHLFKVRLWVDAPEVFLQICPDAVFDSGKADYKGVIVCPWPETWPETQAEQTADVIIEAFACNPPEPYIAAIAQRPHPPLWINLEYLSAEEWVDGCHGLPSPQNNHLSKIFCFPGFTEKTGGLLQEKDLLSRRKAFQTTLSARSEFLWTLGIDSLNSAVLISLFSYHNPALPAWLDGLSTGRSACLLLVPEGQASSTVARYFGVPHLKLNRPYNRGNLRVQAIPFLDQKDYDHLLWSCDLNLVRGEDSFVRAQWAGRPLLWHIYPQEDGAHLTKLEAFIKRYTAAMDPANAQRCQAIWKAWNEHQPPPEPDWLPLLHNPDTLAHASHWCDHLDRQKNLAETLVRFYRNWL